MELLAIVDSRKIDIRVNKNADRAVVCSPSLMVHHTSERIWVQREEDGPFVVDSVVGMEWFEMVVGMNENVISVLSCFW